VNEGLSAVAFALRPSLLLSSRPRRRSLSRCWCSGRRRATWSLLSRRPSGVEVVHTRGSGTGVPFVVVSLSMGVCSLWLLRPEHLGI
jgi:hypothetical protein